MELLTILNHCHRHRGFVYQHARFAADKQSIEVDVRPRAGSAAVCSGCHQPAPGYDHLPQRRFEFIPLWGFLVFLLYRMRRVECRNCGVVVEAVPWCDGKHQLTRGVVLRIFLTYVFSMVVGVLLLTLVVLRTVKEQRADEVGEFRLDAKEVGAT